MSKIGIGLLGLGTIGQGVFKLIMDHKEELEFQVGSEIAIHKILVSDLNKERIIDGVTVNANLLTDKVNDIIDDDSIQIVIEVMGGIKRAKQYMEEALKAGKSVVTANKDVIALHGVRLSLLAQEFKSDIFYEASVGGGIPIIRGLTEGLASDRITKIMGIVNGTTNYILTKMSKENMTYSEALKKAQELGFAEPDPTSDVEGLDAARKMVILSSLGFSMPISLNDVFTRGISKVSKEDILYSENLGYSVKLIGYADICEGQVEVSVQPTLLPKAHPLAFVNDENNAVYLYGSAVGQTMFYGPGAGAMPTATAIVSDVISVIKRYKLGVTGKHMINFKNHRLIKGDDKIEAKFYLRLNVKDQVGVLKDITTVFSEEGLSFETVLQKPADSPSDANLIIITHKVVLERYLKALKKLSQLDRLNSVDSSYRVVSD